MRITATQKKAVETNLLEVAHHLFLSDGFEKTTTRKIAQQAGIGVGTLFNYFPNKEAIAEKLIRSAVRSGQKTFEDLNGVKGLEESLFVYCLTLLKSLKEYRRLVSSVLKIADSGLAVTNVEANHWFSVSIAGAESLVFARYLSAPLPPIQKRLFGSLFLGVLWFWSQDKSKKHEATLSTLDQSTRMFTAFISNPIAVQEIKGNETFRNDGPVIQQ